MVYQESGKIPSEIKEEAYKNELLARLGELETFGEQKSFLEKKRSRLAQRQGRKFTLERSARIGFIDNLRADLEEGIPFRGIDSPLMTGEQTLKDARGPE